MDGSETPRDDKVEQQALIERLADRLVALGLTVPSILALELLEPWSFVGSQVILLAEPLLGSWCTTGQRYAALLEERHNAKALLVALEKRRSARPQRGDRTCLP